MTESSAATAGPWWAAALIALPLLLAAVGIVFQAVALVALRRFFAGEPAPASAAARTCEAVSILKPLYGAEPRLEDNLAGFVAQDYPGPVQLVCGLARHDDAAVPAVERLIARHPAADITLAVDPACHGGNGKVGNLANMLGAVRHDILVLSDSDMAVTPVYLATVLAALAAPGVGAVTCLYRGRGDAGFWSVVAAGMISYAGLPGIVIGHAGRMATPCMGSTIALRRETLAAIGGFARFADVLADDYAIGQAVLEQGQSLAIPPLLLVHGCADSGLAALWRHQLRWAATLRSLRPLSYCGMVFTHPLPWCLIGMIGAPHIAVVLLLATLAIRALLARTVDRIAGAGSAPLWLLPVIDVLGFAVFLASFGARRIDWRGSSLVMERKGRVAAR